MSDSCDMELVRDYSRLNSEAAFAELVQRHIALVYSAALRHVGISAHAEEITQAVFIILARKATGLRPDTILEGWLYETTRLTALSFVRGERRRQFREQEAYMQSPLQESTDASTWNQLAPLLDEAMSRLGKKDRDAVILRFFKEKGVRDVAAILQVNEAAAQRRILRALEKLRKFFTKRGVSSTTSIIAGAISANSVHAAPVALAKSVTAVAIAKSAAASGSTLTLIKGALKIMAWTKAKTAAAACIILIFATGSTMVAVNQIGKYHENKIVFAFIKKPDPIFQGDRDPEFQKVHVLGADAVPYLISAIEKYNSVRDTPPNPKSGHAEGRDLIRIRAYWGLGGLGSSAKSALPFLIQQFSTNNDLLDSDFYALAGFGPEARAAIPVLVKTFHGDNPRMRWYAARALAKIDPNNAEVLPAMFAELKSQDVVSRRFACITLGELGSNAKPAIPALTEALNDEDEWVRKQATTALKEINPINSTEAAGGRKQ